MAPHPLRNARRALLAAVLLLGMVQLMPSTTAAFPPAVSGCIQPGTCVCWVDDLPDCDGCDRFDWQCDPCVSNRRCNPCYFGTEPQCDPCTTSQPPSSCAQCQANPPAPECRNCTDYQWNIDCNPCTGRYEPSHNCPPECRQSSPPPAGCDHPCHGNDPPEGCHGDGCMPELPPELCAPAAMAGLFLPAGPVPAPGGRELELGDLPADLPAQSFFVW